MQRLGFVCLLVLGCFFSNCLGLQLQAALSAELQTYQRRYISIYQQQGSELDSFLVTLFQRELPRFDYPLVATGGELQPFLLAAYAHQAAQAGALAAGQQPEDLHFGDQVVTWSQTQQILNSAYVFAPEWHFSALEISGPEQSQQTGSQGWYLVLKSRLSLKLPLYRLQASGPELQTSFQAHWEIVKLLPIEALEAIRQRMTDELGQAPRPEEQAAFLQALRHLPPFDRLLPQLENQNPAEYMQAIARKVLELELSSPEKIAEFSQQALQLGLAGSLNLFNPEAMKQAGQWLEGVSSLYQLESLLAEIRKTPEFQLKGQVQEVSADGDWLQFSLGAHETPSSLGLRLDTGYRMIEYRQQGEKLETTEIGFVKLRQLEAQRVEAQTILAARPFELGDQYLEYPKTPFELKLRGGTGSLALVGTQTAIYEDFAPEFSAELAYSLAPLLGWSETYLSLNGAFGMIGWPGSTQQPWLPGAGLGSTQVSVWTSELGLSKRFYFRQFILALGARLGLMNGMMNPGQEILHQERFGGTVFLGAYCQLSPDLIFGLDLGWREYFNTGGSWRSSSSGPVNPGFGLGASGPVAGIFLNYQL